MENQVGFPEDRYVIFEKLVRNNFRFLEDNYNFKFSSNEKNIDGYSKLKYLTKHLFVVFYYAPPGFELDFYFGRRGIEDRENKHSFTSGDLLYLEGNEKWANYSVYSAQSYDNLLKCLPKLASFLEECGEACLQGDSSTYEKMLFEQKKDVNRHHQNQESARIKKLANDAWEQRDYIEVVKCFFSIINELTPSESKKLEYSRKKIM